MVWLLVIIPNSQPFFIGNRNPENKNKKGTRRDMVKQTNRGKQQYRTTTIIPKLVKQQVLRLAGDGVGLWRHSHILRYTVSIYCK